MTFYGLNPSFVYNSPLPLFNDLVRRAKRVEADGSIRLMEGPAPMPPFVTGCTLRRAPSGRLDAVPVPNSDYASAKLHSPRLDVWDRDSIAALRALQPTVLRTLDLSMANKRTDLSQPRVWLSDRLQGTDRGMAVELQAALANRLGCVLWWNAPPRFELSVADYETRLEDMLGAIWSTSDRAPILEYGNELWNAGFPVQGWLQQTDRPSWHAGAATEIATLKRVADRVFGGHGPLGARSYYLFVGGQLTVPSHLDKILSSLADLDVTPDLAGPALYVTPLKAHKEEWEATGASPTQDELRSSCLARLEEIASGAGPLTHHELILARHRVPYFACYEAGQSLIAGSHPWRRAAIEAQRTEWMGELYGRIRRVAAAAGVDLLNWYSAATDQSPTDPRVDVFGLLESTDLTKMLPKALVARGD